MPTKHSLKIQSIEIVLFFLQDYKTYLDFVLALENRREPQALQYLFRLLDVQGKGHLNVFDLNFFFRVRVIFTTLGTL